MKRRQLLAAVGSGAGIGVGGYGLYRTAGRTATDPDYPTGETRSGSLLSGTSPSSFSASHLDAVREWTGTRQAIAVFYVDMARSDSEIDRTIDTLEYIWNRGQVPHMFWQPNFGADGGGAQAVAKSVANGEYDDRLESWAKAVAEWAIRPTDVPDRRAYINLAPEFNGDWVPWAVATGGTTPEDFVGMWRRIYDALADEGLESHHVQWVWTVNRTSSEAIDFDRCYPGDDYVDWTGITGYNWSNWGGWKSPSELYDRMLENVRDVTSRPVAFGEFGCSSACEAGHCPGRKDRWIGDVYDYMAERDVRMACWFNHEKETDWGVFDSAYGTEEVEHGGDTYTAYAGYREAVDRDDVLSAHPVDARRLTDDEFRGEF